MIGDAKFMPKFMKDGAITLIDGGIESYLLALYGLNMPTVRKQRKSAAQYAPIIGLFGASVELLVKACLVQANGISSMYKNGDLSSGIYRFGSEVIDDLRKEIRDASACISFLWKNPDNYLEQQSLFLNYLDKFKLLQELRANGLHAGIGCSRDIVVSIANDIYDFMLLLSQGKKLKAYLKNVPAPNTTVRDREAIIEDLTRRTNTAKTPSEKIGYLRNMYLVLPYVPDIEPEWIKTFNKASLLPPTDDDVNYLVRTLSEAHSIYLLKNRGGKDGIPVRVEPNNPQALPISIQNIKRSLNTIPDKFNNDIMSANTRLSENRLDLPIDDFLIDLYALGLDNAKVITNTNHKLTAQQVWPFIAAAYSTQGTPRPCWFFIRACDELDQLVAYLRRVKDIGNGYLKKRVGTVIKSIVAIKEGQSVDLRFERDKSFSEIETFYKSIQRLTINQRQPFTPYFLKKFQLNQDVSAIIHEYILGKQSAGNTLEAILNLKSFGENEKKAALALMPLCYTNENRNGLVTILRTGHLCGYVSQARKQMFFVDFYTDGPKIKGL